MQCLPVLSLVSTSSQQPSRSVEAGTSTAACLPFFMAPTAMGTCHSQGVAM